MIGSRYHIFLKNTFHFFCAVVKAGKSLSKLLTTRTSCHTSKTWAAPIYLTIWFNQTCNNGPSYVNNDLHTATGNTKLRNSMFSNPQSCNHLRFGRKKLLDVKSSIILVAKWTSLLASVLAIVTEVRVKWWLKYVTLILAWQLEYHFWKLLEKLTNYKMTRFSITFCCQHSFKT